MLGGLASVVAISCFYKALAIGTMSIVAPISATNALIPFAVGIAAGERPAALQLAGVVLAAVGVILVAVEPARQRRDGRRGRRSPANRRSSRRRRRLLFRRAEVPVPAPATGIPVAAVPVRRPAPRPSRTAQRSAILLSLLAAVCMGLVLVGYDATARYDPLWAMLGGSRLVGGHLRRRLPGAAAARQGGALGVLPFIVVVGLLDTGANGLFALATTHGYLSLVAVLGSLYPVVTVLLAFGMLRERIAPHQMAGAAATLVGVALIAAA